MSTTSKGNKPEHVSCFVEMASRGLFSFDKTVLNKFSDINYHLVARPSEPLKLNNLPQEIVGLILETRLVGDIQDHLSITQID